MAYNGYYEDIKKLLIEFLGYPQRDTDSTWIQFCCPCCAAEKGVESDGKYNLEVSIEENAYHCWVCGDAMGTKGRLGKLIRTHGGPSYYARFMKIIEEIRQSELYSLDNLGNFDAYKKIIEETHSQLTLPTDYCKLTKDDPSAKDAYEYLYSRGIDDRIINEYQIGYVGWSTDFKMRKRIIIPSYNCLDELNYWIARDYGNGNKKYRYNNPMVPKTSFVFNEGKINWYEDITLVEGVFDHLVTPNSLPLLGKTLGTNDAIYKVLTSKAMSNVNIMLDNDAHSDAIRIYKTLNSSILKGRVRIVNMTDGKDPSDVYRDFGAKGIIKLLRSAEEISEFDLIFW